MTKPIDVDWLKEWARNYAGWYDSSRAATVGELLDAWKTHC